MRDQRRVFIRADRPDFRQRRRLRNSFLGIVILIGGGNGWLGSPADAAEFFEGPMMARPEPVNRWNPPPQPMNRLGGLSEGAKIYQQPSPLSLRPSFGTAGKDLSSPARPVFSPPGKQPAYSASASRNNAEGTQPSVVRPVFPSDHSRPSLASRPEFGSTPPWRGSSLGMSSQDQGRPEFVPPTQSTGRALFNGNGVASEGQYARPGQPAPSTWSYHAPWGNHRATTQANLATHPTVLATSRANPTSHGMAFSAGRYQAPSLSLSGSSANNIATNNAGNVVGSIEQATAHTLSLAGETIARQATPGNVYGTALSTMAGLIPGYGLGIDIASAQNNMVNGANDLRNATSALYSGKLSQAAVGYGGVAWNAGLGFVHGAEMVPAAAESVLDPAGVPAGYALQSSGAFNKFGQAIPQLSSDLIGHSVQTSITTSRDIANSTTTMGSAVSQAATTASRDVTNVGAAIGGAANQSTTTAFRDVTSSAEAMGSAANQAVTTASKDVGVITSSLSNAIKSLF